MRFTILFILLVLATVSFDDSAGGPITVAAAFGGLVTGLLGVVFGSLGLGAQIGAAKATAQFNADAGNSRRKRSVNLNSIYEKLEKEKLEIEIFADDLYEKDRSQCLEKLTCTTLNSIKDQSDDAKRNQNMIQNILEGNDSHGIVYRRMLIGKYVGMTGADCDSLFSTCQFGIDQMIQNLRAATNNLY